MKKLTKVCLALCSFVVIIGATMFLTACGSSNNNENNNNTNNPSTTVPTKEMCTVTYDLNFDDGDYEALQELMSDGLSFDVEGFEAGANNITEAGVDITYTKEIELGRGFILYQFKDKILNNYFEGWYTASGLKVDELNSIVRNDITLYARWSRTLDSLTSNNIYDAEYDYDITTKTASFVNGTAFEVNDFDMIHLPEITLHDGAFYEVNDISCSTLEDRVFFVNENYTGLMIYPMIFPNESQLDSSVTYLGNYVSQQSQGVIIISEVDYEKNTFTPVFIGKGPSTISVDSLKLEGTLTIQKQGEDAVTLNLVGGYDIYIGNNPLAGYEVCSFRRFIVGEDVPANLVWFWNVADDVDIYIYFEATIDEVRETASRYVSDVPENFHIYFYSETKPEDVEHNYWYYSAGGNVVHH